LSTNQLNAKLIGMSDVFKQLPSQIHGKESAEKQRLISGFSSLSVAQEYIGKQIVTFDSIIRQSTSPAKRTGFEQTRDRLVSAKSRLDEEDGEVERQIIIDLLIAKGDIQKGDLVRLFDSITLEQRAKKRKEMEQFKIMELVDTYFPVTLDQFGLATEAGNTLQGERAGALYEKSSLSMERFTTFMSLLEELGYVLIDFSGKNPTYTFSDNLAIDRGQNDSDTIREYSYVATTLRDKQITLLENFVQGNRLFVVDLDAMEQEFDNYEKVFPVNSREIHKILLSKTKSELDELPYAVGVVHSDNMIHEVTEIVQIMLDYKMATSSEDFIPQIASTEVEYADQQIPFNLPTEDSIPEIPSEPSSLESKLLTDIDNLKDLPKEILEERLVELSKIRQMKFEELILALCIFVEVNGVVPRKMRKPKNETEKFVNSLNQRFHRLKIGDYYIGRLTPKIRFELEKYNYNFEIIKNWTFEQLFQKLIDYSDKYLLPIPLIANPTTNEELETSRLYDAFYGLQDELIHKGKLTFEIQNILEFNGYIFDDDHWPFDRTIDELKSFKAKYNRMPTSIKKPKNDEEKFESFLAGRFSWLKLELSPHILSDLEQYSYDSGEKNWTFKRTIYELKKFTDKHGRTPISIQNPETEDEKYEASLALRFFRLKVGTVFKNSFNPEVQAELESCGYSFEVRGRPKTKD
jgi:hypothetical protein